MVLTGAGASFSNWTGIITAYGGNIGGSFGYEPLLAVAPTGANAGNIYVASLGNSILTVLSPDGAILDTIGVSFPSGIAIAP